MEERRLRPDGDLGAGGAPKPSQPMRGPVNGAMAKLVKRMAARVAVTTRDA